MILVGTLDPNYVTHTILMLWPSPPFMFETMLPTTPGNVTTVGQHLE